MQAPCQHTSDAHRNKRACSNKRPLQQSRDTDACTPRESVAQAARTELCPSSETTSKC